MSSAALPTASASAAAAGMRDMGSLLELLQQQTKAANAAIKAIHDTRKRIARAAKRHTSRRSSAGRPHPGLTKTTRLRPSLAALLGVPPETELRRFEVNRILHAYADARGLKDPANRQFILLDAAMAAETQPPNAQPPGARVHMFSLFGLLQPSGARAPASEYEDEVLEDIED